MAADEYASDPDELARRVQEHEERSESREEPESREVEEDTDDDTDDDDTDDSDEPEERPELSRAEKRRARAGNHRRLREQAAEAERYKEEAAQLRQSIAEMSRNTGQLAEMQRQQLWAQQQAAQQNAPDPLQQEKHDLWTRQRQLRGAWQTLTPEQRERATQELTDINDRIMQVNARIAMRPLMQHLQQQNQRPQYHPAEQAYVLEYPDVYNNQQALAYAKSKMVIHRQDGLTIKEAMERSLEETRQRFNPQAPTGRRGSPPTNSLRRKLAGQPSGATGGKVEHSPKAWGPAKQAMAESKYPDDSPEVAAKKLQRDLKALEKRRARQRA